MHTSKLAVSQSVSQATDDDIWMLDAAATRPAVSQLRANISGNFMQFRNVVRQTLKLQSCERVGGELGRFQMASTALTN